MRPSLAASPAGAGPGGTSRVTPFPPLRWRVPGAVKGFRADARGQLTRRGHAWMHHGTLGAPGRAATARGWWLPEQLTGPGLAPCGPAAVRSPNTAPPSRSRAYASQYGCPAIRHASATVCQVPRSSWPRPRASSAATRAPNATRSGPLAPCWSVMALALGERGRQRVPTRRLVRGVARAAATEPVQRPATTGSTGAEPRPAISAVIAGLSWGWRCR
jgi:hypothetical protein